jgi:glucosamine kinase
MDGLVLGLDAGGSATRWVLGDVGGQVHAQGEAPGWSATMLGTLQQPLLDAALRALSATLQAHRAPARVYAGVTGFDGQGEPSALRAYLAQAFGLAPDVVTLLSDIELACRAVFAPGGGILVIAGTGSVAAHLRANGSLERAGGRGGLLDDGGSAHWIAREALRAVWRREDEVPGLWRHSALARALFEQLGDTSWARTREFVTGASRGEMGALAVAVAAAAQAGDAQAAALLDGAGRELARIANALRIRCGAQPIALAGRVPALDARIVGSMRAALPAGTSLSLVQPDAAHAAARLACGVGAVRH